jgi:hypothetical protein
MQRLEGSHPGGLRDLFLGGVVVVVCEVALTVGALPFGIRPRAEANDRVASCFSAE